MSFNNVLLMGPSLAGNPENLAGAIRAWSTRETWPKSPGNGRESPEVCRNHPSLSPGRLGEDAPLSMLSSPAGRWLARRPATMCLWRENGPPWHRPAAASAHAVSVQCTDQPLLCQSSRLPCLASGAWRPRRPGGRGGGGCGPPRQAAPRPLPALPAPMEPPASMCHASGAGPRAPAPPAHNVAHIVAEAVGAYDPPTRHGGPPPNRRTPGRAMTVGAARL